MTFNAAKLVKLDLDEKAKGMAWTRRRVEVFTAHYQQRLVGLEDDPEAAWTGPVNIRRSTPRPSPVDGAEPGTARGVPRLRHG